MVVCEPSRAARGVSASVSRRAAAAADWMSSSREVPPPRSHVSVMTMGEARAWMRPGATRDSSSTKMRPIFKRNVADGSGGDRSRPSRDSVAPTTATNSSVVAAAAPASPTASIASSSVSRRRI